MTVDHITCICTVPSESLGKTIAGELIGKRLAPCVNIVPGVTSIYTWKGQVNEDKECILFIKTRAALFEQVREAIVRLHTYEVPEIIALPITRGHPPYMAWIDENTVT